MKSYYDVQQLLKRFGILVYMGNRLYDIDMSRLELAKIYENGLIGRKEFLQADLILHQEYLQEKAYQQKKRRKKE